MRPPGLRRHGDAHGLAPGEADMLRLDDPIDRKRPARLNLTIAAVTGVNKHGRGGERVLHGTAEAGGGKRNHTLFRNLYIRPLIHKRH